MFDMIPLPPPAIVEVYFAPSCAPCRLELPALVELARKSPDRLRLVIVGERAAALQALSDASPRLAMLAVDKTHMNPRATLLAAGDGDGVLPFAKSVAADGRTCARWRGGLTWDRVQSLLSACSRVLKRPYSQRS